MALKQNFVTGKGETFDLAVTYKDSTGAPVDLTGYSAQLKVMKAGSGDTIGNYAGTVDSTGHINIKVVDETTDTWPVGKSAYVLELAYPNGDEKWLCFGSLTVVTPYV